MKAERQYKEPQQAGFYQSKTMRSKVGFIDNRPPQISQAKLIKAISNKGILQRTIKFTKDDKGEVLGTPLEKMNNEVKASLSSWGVPKSDELDRRIDAFHAAGNIFDNLAALIEQLKGDGLFSWGLLETQVNSDWPVLISHYNTGKISADRRNGIDGAHYKDIFDTFASEYKVEDGSPTDIYEGVKMIKYKMWKTEKSQGTYSKICRKTVTDRASWPPDRLKCNLLSAVNLKFPEGVLVDGHGNHTGSGGTAMSWFVRSGKFEKFNVGANI